MVDEQWLPKLASNNELHVEEEIEGTDSNENEAVDNPRRGAKTLESNWICSGNVSICSGNVSIESQGSEVIKEEDIFGETLAQHRFIDTETVLLHVEEYSGNKHKTDKSIDVDVIEISNHDEEPFVDDLRKGA